MKINDFRGDGSGISAKTARHCTFANMSTPVLLFSKQNKTCLGYFDPENIFVDDVNK